MGDMRIIINCPLCNNKSLDVMKEKSVEIMQCFGCGYSTSSEMADSLSSDNNLHEDLKKFAKEANNKLWIPAIFQMDGGMLYPVEIGGKLNWGFSELVDISEEDKEKYPKEDNSGYYTKRYDNENETKFTDFNSALTWIKKKSLPDDKGHKKVKLNLPILKKV